jgi:hypothetical protein
MPGPAIPEHSIVLLLSVVFCVVAPLVLLTGLAFFGMSLLVDAYNWVWVFRRPYEGGGELWHQVRTHAGGAGGGGGVHARSALRARRSADCQHCQS